MGLRGWREYGDCQEAQEAFKRCCWPSTPQGFGSKAPYWRSGNTLLGIIHQMQANAFLIRTKGVDHP
jgi:hypothetical protein